MRKGRYFEERSAKRRKGRRTEIRLRSNTTKTGVSQEWKMQAAADTEENNYKEGIRTGCAKRQNARDGLSEDADEKIQKARNRKDRFPVQCHSLLTRRHRRPASVCLRLGETEQKKKKDRKR